MTIREFAERVLFSTSLEEKLAAPEGGLVDDNMGKGIETPSEPGRPLELRLQLPGDAGERAEFPRESELRDDKARGRLMHFLCNHELLAAELMALALLKFPEAPRAFRQGLVHTLQEEQQHTRWYLQHMKSYGVAFGELPVNRFFWSAVSGMNSVLDYVSRLPLTFEQANLDYSLYYSQIFRQAGDEPVAQLLQQIHEDEIGHVGYGLRWLRKLKEKEESDFAAWARHLSLPLSVVRGKGKEPLDLAGRRRAGLDAEWVRQVELASGSKGRTPQVHWFNPGAEALAAGHFPDPVAQDLAHDVALAMALVARDEDVLLVDEMPSEEHRWAMREAGLVLPEVIDSLNVLGDRKLAGFRPWARCSIATAGTVDELRPLLASADHSMEESLKRLFSKAFGASVLSSLHDPLAGRECSTLAEIERATEHWKQLGHEKILLKSAFGLAGRGQMAFAANEPITAPLQRWMEKALAADGIVVAEPLLDRVFDFSVQCEFDTVATGDEPTLRLKGFTVLETGPSGQFRACVASSRFSNLMPSEIARFFHGNGRRPWLRKHYEENVFPIIAPSLRMANFSGALGIDAFVYRTSDGTLQLRSVVEINPRFTMGRVTLESLRHLAPDRIARFSLLTMADAKRLSLPSLTALAEHLQRNDPPTSTDSPQGRRLIAQGTLILNEPAKARRFLAALSVNPAPHLQRKRETLHSQP